MLGLEQRDGVGDQILVHAGADELVADERVPRSARGERFGTRLRETAIVLEPRALQGGERVGPLGLLEALRLETVLEIGRTQVAVAERVKRRPRPASRGPRRTT